MSFTQYTWKDREAQTGNRRELTDVDTGTVEVVDVERAEGAVYTDGLQFNADTMNDIEQRLADAFAAIEAERGTILDTIYPVGSIYISMDNTSPANIFGGTWASISGGVLLPSNNCNLTPQGSDTSSYKPTGNVSYSLTCNVGYAELPSHFHYLGCKSSHSPGTTSNVTRGSGAHTAPYSLSSTTRYTNSAGNGAGHQHPISVAASFVGNTQTFNNMMPSITVYAWRRTA